MGGDSTNERTNRPVMALIATGRDLRNGALKERSLPLPGGCWKLPGGLLSARGPEFEPGGDGDFAVGGGQIGE